MSDADREKWDQRYRAGAYAERLHPSALLASWMDEAPRGRALDIACGAGRNALTLAAAGFQVDAVDISAVGLARAREAAMARGLSNINWLAADLEREDWLNRLDEKPSYQLIVWIRYVNAPLMQQLKPLLSDGGMLIVEQHLRTGDHASRGEIAGPSSDRFRLPPQQLLRSADGLRIVHYHEGVVRDPDQRPVAVARLVARQDEAAPPGATF